MSIKTISEETFEEFCSINKIKLQKINESVKASPDYEAIINGKKFIFEIKQLDKDIRRADGSWSLILGSEIRKVIRKKNRQVKNSALRGFPTILLIYNNFDALQLLRTDQHDFTAAMYGKLTLLMDKTSIKVIDTYHGKNDKCQPNTNTSFSVIGGIYKRGGSPQIEIYENVYAKVPIDYASLPSSINAHRIDLQN